MLIYKIKPLGGQGEAKEGGIMILVLFIEESQAKGKFEKGMRGKLWAAKSRQE